MKARDIAEILEKLAPANLAYEGEEMGFVVGKEDKEVKVVGVTERPTVKVLREAVNKKVNMLIVHEPLFQAKKSFLVDQSLLEYPPNKEREKIIGKGGFCVYRFHSNWDDAEGGNNVVLARLLRLKITGRLPYGRIGEISKTTLKQFCQMVKQSLRCKSVLVVGKDDITVVRVAVVAGSGNSLTEIMELAKRKGADVLVSGDIKDSSARFAEELGLAIIDAGDYFTENPGARHLTELLQKELPKVKVLFLDPGQPWKVI